MPNAELKEATEMAPEELADVGHAEENGAGMTIADPFDATMAVQLREKIAHHQQEIDQLEAQLAERRPLVRKYERILQTLTGETSTGTVIGRPTGAARKRGPEQRIGGPQLAQLRQHVLDMGKTKEEFTQAEMRALHGYSSNVASAGFEMLRRENVLRFARQEGNQKFYRLTRAAVQVASEPGTPKVTDSTVERVRGLILEYAKDHPEFRQADILPTSGFSQHQVSRSFRALQAEGIVTVTRESGGNKFWRLGEGKSSRYTQMGISEEGIEQVRAAVLDYARDAEEFRQTDIVHAAGLSQTAVNRGFNALAEDRVIEMVRSGPGREKFYALTPAERAELA